MKPKFEVGDEVERISGGKWLGMDVGDCGIVTAVSEHSNNGCQLRIDGYDGVYSDFRFKLVRKRVSFDPANEMRIFDLPHQHVASGKARECDKDKCPPPVCGENGKFVPIVKELVWRQFSNRTGDISAESACGTYTIRPSAGDVAPYRLWTPFTEYRDAVCFNDIELAKRAAQAHFEGRILSAIETIIPMVNEVVRIHEDRMDDVPYAAGFHAHGRGVSREQCPYVESPSAERWRMGWDYAGNRIQGHKKEGSQS